MTEESDQERRLEVLRGEVGAFPTRPGVYLMRDEGGEVIDVGKAKNLRVRVRSYFGSGDGRYQIQFLMRRVHAVDKIVTDSEEHAFVLERDLITKYKPRYNIRLKDDKAYLNVRVDENAPWPRLELVRRVESDGALYFGPYTFSYELRTVLDVIKKTVPLRTCRDTVFFNRQRPCIEYQIKRCAGPCCLPVDRDEYGEWVQQAISILHGKTEPLVRILEEQMEKAADHLRFEDAAEIRDKIEILKTFGRGHQLISHGAENRDVFAFCREERLATLSVLLVRNGRISDSVNYSFSDVEVSDEDILESAISQFYEGGREIPEEVIVPLELESVDFLCETLSERRGAKVTFTHPKRGLKYRLLGLAELNAKEQYLAKFDAEERYIDIARSLAKMLSLKQVPRRIECIDISNFQGSDIVGALVTFFDGQPDKQAYRKYVIKETVGKPDDFASIHEVVSRRLRKSIENDDLPDVLVIDGGKGQLSAAVSARDELGIDLDIVSIAKMRNEKRRGKASNIQKKPERMFVEGNGVPVVLEAGSETTHFMQRVRDEVHRFAITFHRKSRGKRVIQSVLDEVSGIGPERKRRLLKAYGSVGEMKGISPEDLAKTGRMSIVLAEKLLKAISAAGD